MARRSHRENGSDSEDNAEYEDIQSLDASRTSSSRDVLMVWRCAGMRRCSSEAVMQLIAQLQLVYLASIEL